MQNWKHHRIEKDAAADRRVIPTSFHLDCGAIAPTTKTCHTFHCFSIVKTETNTRPLTLFLTVKT